MSNNVSVLDSTLNPWSSIDKPTLALMNVLRLAEQTGHVQKKRHFSERTSEEEREQMPSLRMISLQKEISEKTRQLQKVNLELQCHVQDKETADITHVDVIECKIEKLKKMNAHIGSIIERKDQLIGRLQQPSVGDCIKMDAAFHKYASELFPQIAPILGDLSYHLDNISWTRRTNFGDGRMEKLIAQTSNALADMRHQYDALVQMRGSIHDVHKHCLSSRDISLSH